MGVLFACKRMDELIGYSHCSVLNIGIYLLISMQYFVKSLLIRKDHYQRLIHRVILGCVMHTLTEMSNTANL